METLRRFHKITLDGSIMFKLNITKNMNLLILDKYTSICY